MAYGAPPRLRIIFGFFPEAKNPLNGWPKANRPIIRGFALEPGPSIPSFKRTTGPAPRIQAKNSEGHHVCEVVLGFPIAEDAVATTAVYLCETGKVLGVSSSSPATENGEMTVSRIRHDTIVIGSGNRPS